MMMSPEDEEEVLLQHFNGATPHIYTDSDSDDEHVLYNKLPAHTTRSPSLKRHKITKIARVFKTIVLCLSFVCLGLCVALPGPTLLDLQEHTHSDTQTISRLFTGRSIGYLFGSIIGGVLFDRVKNHSCLIAFSLIMAAIFNAAAPWSSEILLLISILGAEGFFLGFLDTGGNTALIQIWGRKSAPYMQALHFCFGLGAFVAPLMSEPFLSQSANSSVSLLNNTPALSAPSLALSIHHLHTRDVSDPAPHNPVNISLPDVKTSPKPKKPTKTNGNLLSEDTDKAAGHNVKSDFVKKVVEKQKEIDQKLNTPAPVDISTINQTDAVSTTVTTASTTTIPTTTTTISTTTIAPTTTEVVTSTLSVPTSTVMSSTTPLTNSSGDNYWRNLSIALEKQLETVVYDISHELTTIQFAYLIVSAVMVVVALCFCFDCCYSCCRKHPRLCKPAKLKLVKNPGVGFNFQLISLLFLFFFLYVGMEVTYGGFAFLFVVEQAEWDKSWGSYVTSVFWGSFALTRGLCIIISKFVRPGMMLIVDLVMTVASLLLLLITVNQYTYTLWIGTALLGCGMASIFPSGLSWAELYIDMTGKVTGVFVTASALGEMLLPALTGFLFEKKSPMFLIYVLFASSLLCVVVYILMQNLAFNRGEKYQLFSKVGETDMALEMEDYPLTSSMVNDGQSGDFVSRGSGNGSVSLSSDRVQLNGHSNGKRVHFE